MKIKTFYLLRLRSVAVALLALSVALTSCDNGGDDPEPAKEWITDISMEPSYTIKPGGTITIGGKGFQSNDKIIIEGVSEGVEEASYSRPLTSVTQSGASVGMPAEMVTGKYDFYAQRSGKEQLQLGKGVLIDIEADTEPDITDIPEVSGKNIMGVVFSGKEPLEGVVVSDGYEVVATDSQGRYYIGSEKKSGFVFISIPANYMPAQISGTNMMGFFKRLTKNTETTEQHNFELFPEDNGEHVLVLAADIHLANRTNDKAQFRQTYTPALREVVNANDAKNARTYVMTLGDMTWDTYWG